MIMGKQLNSRRCLNCAILEGCVMCLARFTLDVTLNEIKKRAYDLGFTALEITTREGKFSSPLSMLDELALVSD